MTTLKEKLVNLLDSPYEGPYEGEDFIVNDDGYIQVFDNNIRLCGLIVHKVNKSSISDKTMVKLYTAGDAITLGFDETRAVESIFSKNIGFHGDVQAEIKVDTEGKFIVYINNKRKVKMYTTLAQAKVAINKLDKELLRTVEESEYNDND